MDCIYIFSILCAKSIAKIKYVPTKLEPDKSCVHSEMCMHIATFSLLLTRSDTCTPIVFKISSFGKSFFFITSLICCKRLLGGTAVFLINSAVSSADNLPLTRWFGAISQTYNAATHGHNRIN